MVHLEKSWLFPVAGKKKFFSSTFYHRLSQEIDKKRFDVIYEGYADPADLDSEQPDIVIYDRKENAKRPALLVEFCTTRNQDDVLRTMEIVSRIYRTREAYVYNLETNLWFKFAEGVLQKEASSYSNLLVMDMNKILKNAIRKYYLA